MRLYIKIIPKINLIGLQFTREKNNIKRFLDKLLLFRPVRIEETYADPPLTQANPHLEVNILAKYSDI